MARLEDLTKGAYVRGFLPDRPVKVVDVDWHGSSDFATVTFVDESSNRTDWELVSRDDEARLMVDEAGQAWSMDADGSLFRLASEAKRISLAHLFDPFLAVQTSNLEPLPHQIEAVYSKMLPRQPLRYLLADDPGAGKTIMAGLFCKELMARGDVERCLVIAPGSLVEQWQEELWHKFALDLKILTREMVEASRSGNPFGEGHLFVARLDQLSRNRQLHDKLAAVDWDLIIIDEAHKLSARYAGREVKETKRYQLGRLAGNATRHLLLMTATPHSGIEEDFHLFLRLLDEDRFEGRSRGTARQIDTSDLMRRLVKENLLTFDGKRLFPERRAYTRLFELSEGEALLYKRVTEYVRTEMNRAEALHGDGSRRTSVGFALTILQRRLASSPEAIYQSIRRRKQRLEQHLAEERSRRRGGMRSADRLDEDFDVDDLPEGELEDLEDRLADEASAANTIAELAAEITSLEELEGLAEQVRQTGADRKWEELRRLLLETSEMLDPDGSRRKLIIFTEHRDTLRYLTDNLCALLGPDTVVAIHGGLSREDRRRVQELFIHDKDVTVLVATDAAGEGVNLQVAHLMVNYDLPWNPNRIEQRFGRIHRIGQREVCHLWNLVASETREGTVFETLFRKLEEQRRALGDQVFDVLGESFRNTPLRDLLIEAVRYGDRPEVRARLTAVVDDTAGDSLRELVRDRRLVSDTMTAEDVSRIREDIERAEASRLQPHFVQSFFLRAFQLLGGAVREREKGRFEITQVPSELRQRVRQLGGRAELQRRYTRVTFDKTLITVDGAPTAEFVVPGHHLLKATVDLIIEKHGPMLRRGTVLVAEGEPGTSPWMLVYLHSTVVDGRTDSAGNRRVVSKRFDFVNVGPDGEAMPAGWAAYLDYRPATADERQRLGPVADHGWSREDLDARAMGKGVVLAREHLDAVRRMTGDRVERTAEAVRERLRSQIRHWENRADQLEEQERAGRMPASGMNSANARRRAVELQERLTRRLAELEAERQLASQPPSIEGAALVVPEGLLRALRDASSGAPVADGTGITDGRCAAVEAVLAVERRLGRSATALPPTSGGYDIESTDADGALWFITVKTRHAVDGEDVLRVTRREIAVGLNRPGSHILALVELSSGDIGVRYVRHAFDGVDNVSFDTATLDLPWRQLFERAGEPA